MPNIALDLETIETLGTLMGVVSTSLILTYLLVGDNPLYRLALHFFIGALVGYSFGIAITFIHDTLFTRLRSEYILAVPLLMGLWLFGVKSIPRLAHMGNFVVAYLVGVGVAVALSGALLGTLIPQVRATAYALDFDSLNLSNLGDLQLLADGLLVVVGTVCTLMAFNFAAPKQGRPAGVWNQFVGALAWVGRVFLIFAFGVAFAGALTASLSILIGRIQYILDLFGI
jgi:hypothetical protein